MISLHNIPINLIIGNILTLIAAIYTARSSWAKDVWHIYFYQVVQCLLIAVASIFFNSYAGIITLLVCAFRNYLLAINRFDKKWMIISIILMLIPGIYFNNRGYIGFIVIGANLIYTIGTYLAKKELTIKINIAIDLVMWLIYEVLIYDLSSFVADFIALIVTIISIWKIYNNRAGVDALRTIKKDQNL